MERRAPAIGLVLACLAATLVVGLWIKSPCTGSEPWSGQQYSRWCYTDIVPLFGTEQLDGPRMPYLDPCQPIEGQNCDEYPLLTMYAMRAAAWVSDSPNSFYRVNVLLLAACAFAIAWWLHRLAGGRALLFALAPTLALYAFMNWDLLAVAAATAATVAFLRRRDGWAGALLAVGAAAKLYPAILALPFILQRLRERDRGGAARIAGVAAATWLALNLPFALAAPGPWSTFFRFSSTRVADWDSLWLAACRGFDVACLEVGTLNAVVAALLVSSAGAVWWIKRRVQPDFPRWTLAFPFLVLFLLTGKVYSPQFSLWLLPLFVLILPDVRLFAAFAVADVAVFLTRFSMFAAMSGLGGASPEMFRAAILVRAAVLVACLVAWVRAPAPELAVGGVTVDGGAVRGAPAGALPDGG